VGQITSINAANAIVKLVAVDALELLVGTLVMGNLVNRDFEPALQNQGDTVNVPIPPTLVANNIAEGGQVQNQSPSLGNAQVVLNTHAEASFQIGDIVKVLASPDLAKMYIGSAVAAIAQRIEADIMRAYPLFTDQPVIGGASVIDEPKVDDVETAMFVAKVPIQEPKYFVVSAGTYSDLRLIPRFTEYQSLGEAKQASGKIVHAFALGHDFNLERFKSNMFEMEWPPRSGVKQEFPECDRAAWVPLSMARQKLTKGQVPLLENLAALLQVDLSAPAAAPESGEENSPQTQLF